MSKEIYKCADCDKIYSSYNTLWKHNKNYHNSRKIVKNIITENVSDIFKCRVCENVYSHKQSLYKHEKTCTGIKKPSIELEVEKMKQDTEKMKQETKRIDLEALKLKIKLQSMKQIDDKTFKAVNKILIDRSTNNTMNNSNNTQNITNNYKIFSIGNEDVVKTLSMDDKRTILNRRICSLDKMVEMVHCGNYNMFKNIIITNLKDKYAYMYDENKGYFIITTKTDVLDNLMTNRMMDLEAVYDELSSANKIDEKTKKMIQSFLDKMENDKEPYTDEVEDVEHANYKAYKMNRIKILLYNNQDKITRDIAFLIGDKKTKKSIIPNNEIINGG
jgi:hypothetical protein